MSLINDVLKDLEKRNAPASASAASSSDRSPHEARRRTRQWPLWLLAAVTVGVVLHLSLATDPDPSSATEPGTLTAQVASQSDPEAPATPDTARQGSQPSRTEPPRTKPAPAPTEAETSLAQARNTESTDDSSALQDARPERKTAQGADGTASAEHETQPARSSADKPEQNAEALVAPEAPHDSSTTAEPETTPGTNISIRRADGGGSNPDPLAAAKRMLSRGQLQRAESRLRQLTQDQPALTEGHELLAKTLMHRGQHEAASRALERGLERANEPAQLAALLGRLLIDNGEIARARNVLQSHAPELSDEPDYHLLLAAAYRQAGDHSAAADHYRALTAALPRSGAAWIGLGASLESLEQPAEAANAYNQALESDDDRAVRFARQRLSALEPITGEPQ